MHPRVPIREVRMVFSPSNQSQFSDAEYGLFRQFLEKSCGILLGDNKNYLIVKEEDILAIID